MPQTIWTVGHSNHSLEDFLALLAGARIEAIADVRRFPGSRRNPHFSREALANSLAQAGIAYRHFEDLGGRRSRAENSPNTAWRVDAFNAYADHSATSEFTAALGELELLAKDRRTAVMCAEALPWQCHRRILADVLMAKGWTIEDIFPSGDVKPHPLTPFAKIADGAVTYPGGVLFS